MNTGPRSEDSNQEPLSKDEQPEAENSQLTKITAKLGKTTAPNSEDNLEASPYKREENLSETSLDSDEDSGSSRTSSDSETEDDYSRVNSAKQKSIRAMLQERGRRGSICVPTGWETDDVRKNLELLSMAADQAKDRMSSKPGNSRVSNQRPHSKSNTARQKSMKSHKSIKRDKKGKKH